LRLARITRLTPGDFALIRRRHAITPFADAGSVLDALHQEVKMKQTEWPRMGFM
jgi:hypothetical protein